jgi:hypothetical protein
MCCVPPSDSSKNYLAYAGAALTPIPDTRVDGRSAASPHPLCTIASHALCCAWWHDSVLPPPTSVVRPRRYLMKRMPNTVYYWEMT